MSLAKYWHNGDILDYKNSGSTTIAANTVIELSGRIGVAAANIEPSKVGALAVTGVYKLPKTGTVAISQGAEVYWDGTGVTNTSSATAIGYATEGATAAATEITVKLKG